MADRPDAPSLPAGRQRPEDRDTRRMSLEERLTGEERQRARAWRANLSDALWWLRWGATVGFAVCVLGFSWTLGLTFAPVVGWIAGVVLCGAVMFRLWAWELDVRQNREAAERARATDDGFIARGVD
jgi:hypothetical protein